MSKLMVDDDLVDAIIQSTESGFAMAEVEPQPVGASCLLSASNDLSVIVALYGARNGSMSINMTRSTASYIAARFIGEEKEEFNEDTLDAICEIGNIMAGAYKNVFHETPYQFDGISLPALVFGANYDFYHGRGVVTASVDFEIKEISLVRMRDRIFSSSLVFESR